MTFSQYQLVVDKLILNTLTEVLTSIDYKKWWLILLQIMILSSGYFCTFIYFHTLCAPGSLHENKTYFNKTWLRKENKSQIKNVLISWNFQIVINRTIMSTFIVTDLYHLIQNSAMRHKLYQKVYKQQHISKYFSEKLRSTATITIN